MALGSRKWAADIGQQLEKGQWDAAFKKSLRVLSSIQTQGLRGDPANEDKRFIALSLSVCCRAMRSDCTPSDTLVSILLPVKNEVVFFTTHWLEQVGERTDWLEAVGGGTLMVNAARGRGLVEDHLAELTVISMRMYDAAPANQGGAEAFATSLSLVMHKLFNVNCGPRVLVDFVRNGPSRENCHMRQGKAWRTQLKGLLQFLVHVPDGTNAIAAAMAIDAGMHGAEPSERVRENLIRALLACAQCTSMQRKLKYCACETAAYCSASCQKDHRKVHKQR